MNFKENNSQVDELMRLFGAFVAENPDLSFNWAHLPNEMAAQAPALTLAGLKNALDVTHVVTVGKGEDAAVSVMTGNAPNSPDRAKFLAILLENWPLFFTWIKAYLDMREHGYMLVPGRNPETGEFNGEWLAGGPGFQSLEESPAGLGDSASSALAALQRKLENGYLIDPAWEPEKRQLAYDVEFTYERDLSPGKPALVDGAPHPDTKLKITGTWQLAGTRYGVRAPVAFIGLTEPLDSPAAIKAKRLIVDNLFENRHEAYKLRDERAARQKEIVEAAQRGALSVSGGAAEAKDA